MNKQTWNLENGERYTRVTEDIEAKYCETIASLELELADLRAEVELLRADARLGAMVRRMPEGSELIRCKRADIASGDFREWAIELFTTAEDYRHGAGDMPEDVLIAAGCGEEESKP